MRSCSAKAALFVARSVGQTTLTLKNSPTSLGQPGGWLLILGGEVGEMAPPPHPLPKESRIHNSLLCASTMTVSHAPKSVHPGSTVVVASAPKRG